ncbi:efflux RND transporter permease subunit [Sedimentitalea todarodis]|uniref:Efflux RND transporter permease subunit n=1 Tax=Sedimentitalea todarodis TaxID=1631240 RepID=A0ABU3VBQ2_9RHOB|nr:efflux RND transporter permease subunit [Sedimentitalea todarodis]MDU9003607.1 efflux RND transporter permease subunit [Sedimentitalea todarodis]
MTGIVTWASERARMVLAFIALSLIIGGFAYANLPKEGEPDIEIPALFVSVQFPGISAEDSESLLVKPMETELADLDGLKTMSSTAAENYAGVALEFDFGWDKTAIMADVRDAMNSAQAELPDGAEQYSITEINFSEFPIVIVNLTGAVPERTMARVAKALQDDLEALDAVLEAGIAGNRDEMLEVVIDPLRLESYNITALELINVVRNNNQLIAAGEIETDQGKFSVKIPSSFDEPRDVYNLPIKTNGDRVVTLGELAEINFTFEDRAGTARFNGESTVALQVVKRKGFNLIDTVALVKETLAASKAKWPPELQAVIKVGTSNDQSRVVGSMVSQLEGSVLTAVALVMIVVLAALGSRAALLVGFAIPTSFLLCFMFLAIMGITISNIVMFGLILAVGMLVDGAIVVVEYADKRIKEGVGPMHAYVEAAQRMFWPIVSSTATTLCAFLPMLFWPGVPGEFMGMLPVTLIFVLSASLIVALVYLPVMGGVTGRMSRLFGRISDVLRARLPWAVRALLVPIAMYTMFLGAMQVLNPAYLLPAGTAGVAGVLFGALLFLFGSFASSVTLGAARIVRPPRAVRSGHQLSPFGHFIKFIAGNPIMPIVAIATVFAAVFYVATVLFPANSRGVEFFVESEPEQANVYVRARGNISLHETDEMVRQVEEVISAHPAVINVFAFAGSGGLDTGGPGQQSPQDTVGQVQFEIIPWEDRPTARESWFFGKFERDVTAPAYDGDFVIDQLNTKLQEIPGFEAEILPLEQGPGSGKPIHLRLKGDDWGDLTAAAETVRAHFDHLPGLIKVEDTLPLPGIDWQIDVEVEKAGQYGADVATVGGMVQLVTRGILLDTMRVDSSDEEIEIRVRLPEQDRVLSTLDSMKVRTSDGLVPLSNFISRKPVAKLAEINRVDQQRIFDVKADVGSALFKVVTPHPDTEAEARQALVRALEADIIADGATLENDAGDRFEIVQLTDGVGVDDLRTALAAGDAQFIPVNANERITVITEWLETNPLPASIDWEWTGDQEEQEESGAFLQNAFLGALGLMFIILLAQFNSFYNSVLVLLAVVLSTTGVLIGMMVMQQPFSIIMTGTGIVALAGIVVNNNIVLIDTYQEFSQYMPRIEAIIRTAEARIRPVLLTTITTMAGLAPMMFGLSLDFINGGYSIDSPTSLWWKQLATAVVFGLGIATVLTLIVTPSFLALRVWFSTYATWIGHLIVRVTGGKETQTARDMRLDRAAREIRIDEIIWEDLGPPEEADPKAAEAAADDPQEDSPTAPRTPLKAAE